MELTCVRRPSKKDGKLRLYWQTKFQVSVKQLGESYEVESTDSLIVTHRTMKRLLPVFLMFEERMQGEPAFEGTIASILIVPEDMTDDGGRGFSRILQALKDSYREMHPITLGSADEKSSQ